LKQDFVLAAEWYEKAVAQGCVEARHRLGEMYYYGAGGSRTLSGR
jgi:TPR repeat protein